MSMIKASLTLSCRPLMSTLMLDTDMVLVVARKCLHSSWCSQANSRHRRISLSSAELVKDKQDKLDVPKVAINAPDSTEKSAPANGTVDVRPQHNYEVHHIHLTAGSSPIPFLPSATLPRTRDNASLRISRL